MIKNSVVIPTLNAGPDFEATLEAVRSQRDAGEVEILVVDSASDDGTVERARQRDALVHMIDRNTFNHGLTRNLGAAICHGEHIAFLTQDALPKGEHWLAALSDALVQNRAAAAYSRVVPRPDCSPLVRRSVENDLVFSDQRQVKNATSEQIEKMLPFERRVYFHFNNVSSMVRRDVLQRLPFPEIAFGEDLAWCEAALRTGETVVFEPASVVIHSHPSRLATDHARHREDAWLMRTLFGLRNRDGFRDSLRGWWLELGRDARYLRELSQRQDRSWFAYLPAQLYSPWLRAAQIFGQWRGSHDPAGPGPRFDSGLPSWDPSFRAPGQSP